ncbi:ABC transporter permease [Ornithinicoccus hortensis]|uniref:ABC-2 type transport system permease protein n=1 Tax=Ornithinicoccus hortensis TaxID=82346 RepID=A0A542YN85_9MICO|nr:ABC transporter permease [Ornithinicoccus hortensis]TQL49550.1 ABC-2 type transport system permease protein [Ornithinicoccus hortensis]
MSTQQTTERPTEGTQPVQAAGTTSEGTRPWVLVMMREIQVRITDKNFLMSTGLTLLLVIGVFAVTAFIGGGSSSDTVAVTDDEGAAIVSQAETILQADDAEASITALRVADEAAGEQAVMDGDADALLTPNDNGWTLGGDGEPGMDLTNLLSDVVRGNAMTANAEAAGTTVEELTAGSVLTTADFSGSDSESQIVLYLAGIFFAMLFYMASLMFGMAIANSVVEEKQSRIVEILAAMIPVRQLLTGKVLGNTLLALGQMVLITGIGLIGLTFTDYDQMLPQMSGAIMWYIPFFLVGFLALACIWAAAGAMASRTEDLQSTTTPLTMVLVIIFVVGINLEGTAEVIASFVPVASTILMPLRILQGGVDWWEPAVALLLTLVFAALTVAAGARLYRRSLLQTSGRLSWRKAWTTGD